MAYTLHRLPKVLNTTGESRSNLYLKIQKGLFTKPVPIGARAVAWPAEEIKLINAARIAGKSERDIRALVTRLEAKRQACI